MEKEYTVIWSKEDSEYIAKCIRYPSLSFMSIDAFNALKGLIQILEDEGLA